MTTVIYTEPHPYKKDIWIIGWSKSSFEKVKGYIFFKGNFKEAQGRIDSYKCKKYIKRKTR